jgi:hypothetical protein
MPSYKNLLAGDSAPWFHVRCTAPDEFAFDTAGGRYLVLCFFMTASDARGRSAVAAALEEPGLFDEVKAAFFGVSVDPADKALSRVAGRVPGTSTATSAGCMAPSRTTPIPPGAGCPCAACGSCSIRRCVS